MDIAFWKIGGLAKYLRRNKIDVVICCQNKDVKIGAKAAKEVGIKKSLGSKRFNLVFQFLS